MSTIPIKTITALRDTLYSVADVPGITAYTRNGRFAGVLISAGPLPADQSRRLLERVRHNPEHTLRQLTQKALS